MKWAHVCIRKDAIYMIAYEIQEVVTRNVREVPVSGQCDVCGCNLQPVDKSKLSIHLKDDIIYDYYRITTHHHDWGNDSIESYEDHDCCSIKCALNFIENYYKDCTKHTPWPTLELEMKHEYKLVNHRDRN